MVGGGAFNVFSEQVIHKLPEGTVGIVGEGDEEVGQEWREFEPGTQSAYEKALRRGYKVCVRRSSR